MQDAVASLNLGQCRSSTACNRHYTNRSGASLAILSSHFAAAALHKAIPMAGAKEVASMDEQIIVSSTRKLNADLDHWSHIGFAEPFV